MRKLRFRDVESFVHDHTAVRGGAGIPTQGGRLQSLAQHISVPSFLNLVECSGGEGQAAGHGDSLF